MNVHEQHVREVATEVGEAYLAEPNSPDASIVMTAYQRLQSETDRLFQAATQRRYPGMVRIVFTWCREPYASDRELIAAVRATRVLEITTAAVHSGRIHPLFGCENGGPFDRFRAVHDLVGHVCAGFGFDLADEMAAWRVQDKLHGRLARWALATEILGVNSARANLGEAPEQKAVLLDQDLLRRSRAELAALTPAWHPA